jgi:hypothetical protein
MQHLRIVGVTLMCVVAASLCLGQQLTKKMSNQDVIEMVSLGLSDDVVIDKIHGAAAADFDTGIDALKALKAAKVPDSVIRAMINPHPALTEPSHANASPVNTNPNDPTSLHDAGIYMFAKSRDGLQMLMLEPTVYSQGKTGGMFASAVTYGIAKVKWKAVVRGAHANVRSSDDKMMFYFYFEEANAGLSHASFGGTTTPNEFTLLRFDEKKETRETVVMKGNAFGASSGTDDKANIAFTFTKIRPGVYRVVPNAPLKPGEYCFLTSSGVGTFGAGSAGASRLFDFAVSPPE